MPTQDNKSNFEFYDYQKSISIVVERPVFNRVLEFLQNELGFVDLAEISADEITKTCIDDAAGLRQISPLTSWWRDRIALIGCGIDAFIVAFVFIIGIIAIAELIPLPR